MRGSRKGPAIAAAGLAALACGFALLGRWQLERAGVNAAISERFAAGGALGFVEPPFEDPTSLRFRRVRLNGRFDDASHILLDNMTHAGRAGYQVLSVFEPTGWDKAVLVNRGFVASDGVRTRLPDVTASGEPTVVTGKIDFLPRAAIRFPSTPEQEGSVYVLSFPSIAEIETLIGRDLEPFQVLLDSAGPGFTRDWQPPPDRSTRNLAYAYQWFALGLAAVIAAVGVVVRARRPAASGTAP